MKSFSESYKAAGVDITAGYEAVKLMKEHIARTKTKGVMSPIGGFGGLFAPDLSGIKNPVLVSGTDGVGTKLKMAFLMDRHDTVDNTAVKEGDIIIGLKSSGVHSNGFSLVRKIFDVENKDIKSACGALDGKSIGETLLEPTKIYVKSMCALFEKVSVKAVSHITGGGFYENIPRSIPEGFCAKIERNALCILPIFTLLQKEGNIPERDMFNTFNMGIGMSAVVDKNDADRALEILKSNGEDAYIIGEIEKSDESVKIC